jgi:hypothetical protein
MREQLVCREELLILQDRMAEKLPHAQWGLVDIVLQFQKVLFDFGQILKSHLGFLMEQLNDDVNHVVGDDIILEKGGNLEVVVRWGDLVQLVV